MRRGICLLATAACVAMMPGRAAAVEHHCQIGKLLDLPVTIVDRQPTVEATLDGHALRLAVDSGAFFSSLSPGTAAEYGFKRHMAPQELRVYGIGGEVETDITTIDDFKLGRLQLHHVEFLVGGSEVGAAGLLGQNILGVTDVEYDLGNGAIRLMRPEHCDKDLNLAYWAKGKSVSVEEIEPVKSAQFHTQGTVVLNGVKLKAMFDTGAATTLLSTRAAARAGVKPDSPGVVEAGYQGGLGRGNIETWIGSFDSLQIGDDERIEKIRLRFGDLGDMNDIDMLIGADFFLSHRVYVSNKLHRMYFTYNGGPVFDLSMNRPIKPVAGGELTSAAAYGGRGMASAARHEYAAALADLTHAVELAPDDGHYRYQRATIELAMHDEKAGSADLDAAIARLPDDATARLARAWLRVKQDDHTGAETDADAADRILATPSDTRFELGTLYDALDLSKQAIRQYGIWIDAHPRDNKLATAYNNRCWARVTHGMDLDDALSDCNHGLHLQPHDPSILDSRGLVRLKRGEFGDAIDDYDDALKRNPKIATSLYGRGVAKLRLGQKAAGDADIAAAKKLDADIAATMKEYGVSP